MVALPSLTQVVASLEQLGVRFWRWPGGRLAMWPPVPPALASAVHVYKPALLDLADARGREPPEWAREPDPEGWYETPGDERVRLLAGGGLELDRKPAVWEAHQARMAAYPPEEWAAICEACLSDDVKPLFPHGLPGAGDEPVDLEPWDL